MGCRTFPMVYFWHSSKCHHRNSDVISSFSNGKHSLSNAKFKAFVPQMPKPIEELSYIHWEHFKYAKNRSFNYWNFIIRNVRVPILYIKCLLNIIYSKYYLYHMSEIVLSFFIQFLYTIMSILNSYIIILWLYII